MSQLLDRFLDLCVIQANSKREGLMAQKLRAELSRLGLAAEEDGAARAIGGESGNLFARRPPAGVPSGWISLFAHMDAVPPGCGEAPYVEAGRVRPRGGILSADDRAGVAIILQILEDLGGAPLERLGVQAVFTVSEESGPTGAGALAREDLVGDFGVVLDTGGPPGQINFESPTAKKFKVVCEGRAAHAGIEPEKGINALLMACRLVSALPSGRLDGDTTFSCTLMTAGSASNVIPSRAVVEGELRTFKPGEAERLLSLVEEKARGVRESLGGETRITEDSQFPPFKVDPDNPFLKALLSAAEREGFRGFLHRSGGGSDANQLNPKGLPAVNVGVGYRHGHSPQEQLILDEFEGTYRWITRFLRELDAG
jgi:tripeptide aminopeptidase